MCAQLQETWLCLSPMAWPRWKAFTCNLRLPTWFAPMSRSLASIPATSTTSRYRLHTCLTITPNILKDLISQPKPIKHFTLYMHFKDQHLKWGSCESRTAALLNCTVQVFQQRNLWAQTERLLASSTFPLCWRLITVVLMLILPLGKHSHLEPNENKSSLCRRKTSSDFSPALTHL